MTSATSDAAASAVCKTDTLRWFVVNHGTECMATRAVRRPSILLVSNPVGERQVYARALRAEGYRVVTAATTVAAYEIATTRSTDIVVTDGHCAGSMSGLELTRRLRIDARTRTVPIIVLTTEIRRQDGAMSIKAGADMFLERPVSAMCCASTSYGCSTRVSVSCAIRHDSTNTLVSPTTLIPKASERARNVVASWSIATSHRCCRRN